MIRNFLQMVMHVRGTRPLIVAGARLLVATVLLGILGVGSAQAQDAEATTRVGPINIQPAEDEESNLPDQPAADGPVADADEEAADEAAGIDIEQNIPETPVEREDAIAVVIGLQTYASEQVPNVKYADRDASTMREYLTNTLGYREENILPRNPNPRMTSGQMKTLFKQQLPSYVREGTEVFVYYSGHGAPGGDGEHAYLVPSDADPNYVGEANSYRLDRFREDLSRVAENKNVSGLTVVLDACFSGQNKRGDMMIRQASPMVLSVENPLLLQENATVFTAGTDDQVANWYPEMKHGMFTYFFLKALQGAADENGDREITVQEVKNYVQDERDGVPYWSRRLHQREQTPQVSTSAPDRVLVQLPVEE